MTPNRLEKRITLRAPQSRVWRAITDPSEFGAWFGAQLSGTVAPGATLTGRITTPGYEHLTFEVQVESVEPESLFSFRWHPYAVDSNVDYAGEPTTLVEFRLAEAPGGTALTVSESGFDQIPEHRRAEAFRMNEGGWEAQVENIARYVA
jgi:uncharacterized protein YndB with AHSA1/START domain